MPEWSIGPHSKCGERATVPRVRIPVSPLNVPNPLNIRNLEDFLLKKRDKIRGFFEAIETLSPAETPADQIRAAREGRPSGA